MDMLGANPSPIEDEDPGPRVGATVRRLRRMRSLSLAELAARSGVSAGLLSEIERDLANPSLKTLTRIRMALDVPLSALFEDREQVPGDPDFVRRAARRPRLNVGPKLLEKELLSSSIAQNLQFMILHLPPGGSSGDQMLSYSAEKAGFVLEGSFALSVDGVEVLLRQGDSFQFDSLRPHGFRNPTDRPARVIWIIGQTKPERHL
jgi:transcriptional regulator with XRE-family HTH domain